MAVKFNKLEGWLNVPAVLKSGCCTSLGEIQYGVREFDVRGFSSVIPTKKRGIPLQWLIEESRKHYSGYGSAPWDNEAQKNRRYGNLPQDSIKPNFWFAGGTHPAKLLTVHRGKDKITGIASDDYHFRGSLGQQLFLYTIRKQ